tara:strand:+ start:129 stop:1085 length:957 start_codon:yes stop_codon:yes gene_type:complete
MSTRIYSNAIVPGVVKLLLTTENNPEAPSNKHESQSSFVSFDTETQTLFFVPPHLELYDREARHRPSFRPFGITIHKNSIYVASNRKLIRFNKKTFSYQGIEKGCELGENTHEIATINNKLWICSTALNRVTIWDGKTNQHLQIEEQQRASCDDKFPLDKVHVSSLCSFQDSVFILLHNGGSLRQPYPEHSHIMEIETKTFKTKNMFESPSIGMSCHSLMVNKDSIWFLTTDTGELKCLNRQTKEVEEVYPIFDARLGWVRGATMVGNEIFICVGNYRQMPFSLQHGFLRVFNIINKTILNDFLLRGVSVVNQMISYK